MLTARQNMLEVIKGGNPDRVVNQYEAISLLFNPFFMISPLCQPGDMNVVNAWGVTNSFPEGTPGQFPVHTPDKIVIKDIEHWRDYVHAPSLKFTDEQWGAFESMYAAVDREKAWAAAFVAPGLFEQCHHLGEISNTMMNLYEYPDEMHDLIKYLTDWELELAEGICSHLHPDMLFHHDDMGSQKSTFMSPEMWGEFYVDAYKEIYGYYKSHGVELVVHHSDGYAATLVPAMIEMGIDVWQGAVFENNIPKLVAEYGGAITIQGGLDNGKYDMPDWTDEKVRAGLKAHIEACGPKYIIPALTMGGPETTYEGLYERVSEIIAEFDPIYFPQN